MADDMYISGLSNCGYSAEESAALADRWRSHLNDHHLFTELEAAMTFRDLTDERVTEHAPFQVIGLWRVPQ